MNMKREDHSLEEKSYQKKNNGGTGYTDHHSASCYPVMCIACITDFHICIYG